MRTNFCELNLVLFDSLLFAWSSIKEVGKWISRYTTAPRNLIIHVLFAVSYTILFLDRLFKCFLKHLSAKCFSASMPWFILSFFIFKDSSTDKIITCHLTMPLRTTGVNVWATSEQFTVVVVSYSTKYIQWTIVSDAVCGTHTVPA